jgi:hypothetical protein
MRMRSAIIKTESSFNERFKDLILSNLPARSIGFNRHDWPKIRFVYLEDERKEQEKAWNP